MLFAVGKRPKDSICVLIQGGLNMASSLKLSLWTERIAYLRIVNRGLAEETVQ